MAIFKCKMCGGDLNIEADVNVVECEYCGTTQTVPALDSEKKVNLFNRANRLRLNSEFDKAAGIYENIIAEFPEEAEAYWGLCLCNYGIEYVDDPVTAKKIPTCHRASFEKLSSDENFNMAMEYADVVAQKVYRDEAREVDRIMEEILSISKNEKPYDVFICYKETDDKGERTIDSVLAQDIYDSLTAKGMKVFFARITLEDKLGQMYEPYIFAALNSAKVMLVVGTKYEHFHAVWVKNEWSRFLKLVLKDKSKIIIPCYKDMDAYDLPDEFKALQAQDMSKIGFMQDLTRGVEKIVGVNTANANTVAEVKSASGTLTTRGYFYLEDKEYEKANEYFEKALDENPMDAMAYAGKTLCRLRLSSLGELENITVDLNADNDFMRALKIATGEEKNRLEAVKEKADKSYQFLREADDLKKSQILLYHKKVKEFLGDSIGVKSDGTYRNKCWSGKSVKEVSNGVMLMTDGTVTFDGVSGTGGEFELWTDIVSISCSNHIVGVKSDGTVLACGNNVHGQCNVSDWTDIVSVDTSSSHTVGLKKDGTVVAVGQNHDGQCDISDWKDIISVLALTNLTVGLKKDGTVVAVGNNYYGQCNVSDWKDVVTIAATGNTVIGIKRDGTVVLTGKNDDGQYNVEDWKDIIAVSTAYAHIVGLKSDGTVVAVGRNKEGQCNVKEWKNIIAVYLKGEETIGLKTDGTIISTDSDSLYAYKGIKVFDDIENFEKEVEEKRRKRESEETPWELQEIEKSLSEEILEKRIKIYESHTGTNVPKEILQKIRVRIDKKETVLKAIKRAKSLVSADYGSHMVGVNIDGTVVAVGDNEYGQCNIGKWRDIVAVSTGYYHTVGLKSDGTVVAVGDNDYGKCDVSDWKDIVAVSAGSQYTIGLKSDGTVLYAGKKFKKYDSYIKEINSLENIVDICLGRRFLAALRKNGTVKVIEISDISGSKTNLKNFVHGWRNIAAIYAEGDYIFGCKENGEIVSNLIMKNKKEDLQDVVAVRLNCISSYERFPVFFKVDGTFYSEKLIGDININGIEVEYGIYLKTDGTVTVSGEHNETLRDAQAWKLFDNIYNWDEKRKAIDEAKKAEERRQEEERKKREEERKEMERCRSNRRAQGLCQHCGGTFKGLFTKKCSSCGKEKDY